MRDDSGFGPYRYGGPPEWPGYGQGSPAGGYVPPPPPDRPKRRGGLLSYVLVAVLAAGLAVGVTVAIDHQTQPTPANAGSALPGTSAVPRPAPTVTSPAPVGSAQQVVNKVEPGLVVINTALQYSGEAGAGTGMVINSAGLVLTNNHVIEDSTKITATVVSTGKTYTARVVGYDTTGDVALIQLEGASGLHTIPVGNSATVRQGDSVVAMGNAEGQGTIVPVGGSVTGLDKTITASDEGGSITSETLHGMIQTNADIVNGDSGGPLASTAGLVIGMDTAASTVSFGLQQQGAAGFAIPINTALSVARQIAAGHASSTVTIGYPAFIGIFIGSGTDSNPQAQAQQQDQQNGFGGFGGPGGTPSCYTSNAEVGVPSSIAPVNSGTLVDGTICGSPAAKAGMTGGSVIVAVNGSPVGSPASLTSTLARLHAGDTISVTWVSPSGSRTTSRLTLAAGPPQ